MNKTILKNWWRIIRLVWEADKKYLILEVFFIATMVWIPVVVSWASGEFINVVTSTDISSIRDQRILTPLLLVIILPFVEVLFGTYRNYAHAKCWNTFTTNLLLNYSKKSEELDVQILENSDFNNLKLKTSENQYRLWSTFNSLKAVFSRSLAMLASLAVLISFKWWLPVLIIIAALPDLILDFKLGDTKWGIWHANAGVKRKFFEIQSYFRKLSAIMEVKLGKMSGYFLPKMKSTLDSVNQEFEAVELKRFRLKRGTLFFLYFGLAVALLVLVNGVVTKVIAVGTFTFLFSRVMAFQSQLGVFLERFVVIREDQPFVKEVFEYLDKPNILVDGHLDLKDSTPKIVFENVSFAYPDTDTEIIRNFNFEINPGEKLAIVGVNGAGKTTLTKLIMRFYDATSGHILIDGENIKNVKIDSYYKKIGYLSQDYARYRLPVKEMISLGDVGIPLDEKRVIEAAKSAGAYEFIMEWKDGFDTHLGKEFEGGVEPSVGQWQKLALARMFYRDPQIWILDEPTASIDAFAEMKIFETLENLPKDKTVILISHRFNTVKNADKIMVIDEGEIKEIGSHKELMKIENGLYKNLFELQKGSYDEAK